MNRKALVAALLLSLAHGYADAATLQSTAFTYQGMLSASGERGAAAAMAAHTVRRK